MTKKEIDLNQKKYPFVNLKVEIRGNQVTVWACNRVTGENVFRLKAVGKVHAAKIDDIILTPTFEMHEVFDVERTLSLILQPSTPIEKIRQVAQARDRLRELIRKAGYKGNF